MKLLIQTHTSQLMAFGADELLARFGPCLGIIEHRVNNLRSLHRVKGRLDVLLSQMGDDQQGDIIEVANEKLLVYQDDSGESDDEQNQQLNGSGDDDQWDDAKSEEEMNGVEEDSEEDDDEDANDMDVTDDDDDDEDEDDSDE